MFQLGLIDLEWVRDAGRSPNGRLTLSLMHCALGLCFWVVPCEAAVRSGESQGSPQSIAIAAAYAGELEAIRKTLVDEIIREERVINGVKLLIGSAYGKEVVFFLTGVSTVNAAMTTQLVLSHFEVSTLLFSGIAGGVNPELRKGDVAVPADWHYHAEGVYFNESEHESGSYVIPKGYPHNGRPNFGMYHPEFVRAVRQGLPERVKMEYFAADPDLLTLVSEVRHGLNFKNAWGERAHIKIGGRGATGPVFIDNAKYRRFIFDRWGSDCVDMESTAIAHVCWANRVPFLIIRGLSDLAGGISGENIKEEYEAMAKYNAAKVLDAVLRVLAVESEEQAVNRRTHRNSVVRSR